MANIQPRTSSTPVPSSWSWSRDDRTASRELSRLDAATSLELARVDAVIEVQQEKVRALQNIGTTAMLSVSQLSQAETALAQVAPNASGRLAAIADVTALLMTEIVVDSAREMRRGRR